MEKRRTIQGHVAAWEGPWEAAATRGEQAVTLPLVMVIECNEEEKGKSLPSYAGPLLVLLDSGCSSVTSGTRAPCTDS